MVESVLDRVLGVVLFSMLPVVWVAHNEHSEKKRNDLKHRYRKILSILLLILNTFSLILLISVIAVPKKFDPSNPSTYAQHPYTTVSNLTLDQNIDNVKGMRIDESYYYEHNDGRGHSFLVFHSDKLALGDSARITIYCNISAEHRNGAIGLGAGNPVEGYAYDYADYSKRDEWQKLEVRLTSFKGDYRAYIILNSNTGQTPPVGAVTFAYPEIEIFKNRD